MGDKNYDIKSIQKNLQKHLTGKRYEHTLGVEKTAAYLAKRYECDIKKTQISALLHDCAKNISDNKKLKLCKKYKIELSKEEKNNPDLIHAKLGAEIAKNIYKIEDKDILNAIAYHTTGRPNMSLLEKIIYIADYIEPGRTKAANLSQIRKLAKTDLDKALLKILKDTVMYLKDKDKVIDTMTEEAYKYYKSTLNKEAKKL